MRKKNAHEIFGLLNKFSFARVLMCLSFSLPFSVCFSSLSRSRSRLLSWERRNHRETIADDLNEQIFAFDVHWCQKSNKEKENGQQRRNNINEITFLQVIRIGEEEQVVLSVEMNDKSAISSAFTDRPTLIQSSDGWWLLGKILFQFKCPLLLTSLNRKNERGRDLHQLSSVGPKTKTLVEARQVRERGRKEQNAKPLDSFHRLTPLTVIVQSSNRKVGAKKRRIHMLPPSFAHTQRYLLSRRAQLRLSTSWDTCAEQLKSSRQLFHLCMC